MKASSDHQAAEGDDWKTQSFGEVLIAECVGIVVFRKDVQEASVDDGSNIVELADVSVLQPIDEHFGSQDNDERSENVSEGRDVVRH